MNPLTNPDEVAKLITDRALAYGIDPRIALQVAKSEGLRSYVGDQGSSFGPFQLHYGGVAPGGNRVSGLGDEFTKQTGLDARDPNTIPMQVDFALKHAAQHGWGAFHGAAKSGIDNFSGIGKQVASADNEDWFETSAKKFTGHMAPKDAQPAAPAAPDPGDWFEQSRQKFTGHMAPDAKPPEDYLAAPEPAAPTQWGPGRALMRGATVGGWPYVEAALRHPIESFKHPLTPVSEIPGAGEDLRKLQEDQKLYAQQNPIPNALLEGVGSLFGTALPMGTAARVIGGAGKALARAVPALEGPLGAAGRFVTGKTAEKATNIGAYVPRTLSYMAQGGVQGAGAGLLTHGLTNTEDQSIGESTLRGAIGGAALAPVLNPLFARAASVFKPEMDETMRQIALNANKKFGLNIRPTQIAKQGTAEQLLDEKVIPHYVNDAQIVKFNEELAKLAKVTGPLTNDNVQFHMRQAGSAMENAAAATTMSPTRAFMRKMQDAVDEVYSTTIEGDPLRKKIDTFTNNIYNELAANRGAIDGKTFKSIVGYNGKINNTFFKDKPGLAKDLRDTFYNLMQANDPAQQAIYDEARQTYHKLATIEPLTRMQKSELVNPQALLARVNKKHITGDMKELAKAGQYLPRTTSTGNAAGAKMNKGDYWQTAKDIAYSAAPFIGPLGVSGVGLATPTGAAILSGILGGGQYAGAAARNYLMHDPRIVNSVLNKSQWPTRAAEGTQNVLNRFTGEQYSGAGWGWGQ